MLRKRTKQFLQTFASFVFGLMLFAFFIFAESLKAQEPKETSTSTCSVPSNAVRNRDGELRIFSSEQLMTRVHKIEPIERPWNLKRNNIFGTAVVDVVVNEKGRLSCIQPVEGHPLAMSAIVRSLRKWEFKVFCSARLKWSMVGRLKIPYDFR